MNERAFQKMASPLARRLQNMLARGVVAASNAAAKMQALQVRLLAGETADALEHFEPYGFTSRPLPGAEVAALFVDGDRSHGLVLVAADRRYRMTGFAEGEVAIHDDQGQSMHFTRGGIVIKGAGLPIRIEGTPTLTVVADTSVTLDTPQTVLTGDLQLAGSLTMAGGAVTHDGVDIGKTHKHSGVTSGSSNTGNPI